jgi:hypothetical protein
MSDEGRDAPHLELRSFSSVFCLPEGWFNLNEYLDPLKKNSDRRAAASGRA